MRFSSWLRTTREEQGLNIRALSQQTGVDPGTISRVENNSSEPTLHTAMRLADGLNVAFAAVVSALNEEQSPKTKQPSTASAPKFTLTQRDAEDFLALYMRKPS